MQHFHSRGVYTRSSQINFSGKLVDFSEIHSDMACIESLHHSALPEKDKSKNICLIRFTPVYEVTSGSDLQYEKENTECKKVDCHSTQRETVFFSSFDPSHDLKGKTSINDGNFYWCNSKLEHEDDFGRCFCSVYRWAGGLTLLREELVKRAHTHLNISKQWCSELKIGEKITSINEAVHSLEQSIATPPVSTLSGLSLSMYMSRINESLQDGCKRMSTNILNLACSEQSALSCLKESSDTTLSIRYLKHFTQGVTPSPHRVLKTIVFHMHTTKHPCHMCGFSSCIEFLENTPEYLALKEELAQTGKISRDFRIVVLCSYRYTYALRDGGELPNTAAIALSTTDHLEFDNPENFYRIGLFKLRQKFVADI